MNTGNQAPQFGVPDPELRNSLIIDVWDSGESSQDIEFEREPAVSTTGGLLSANMYKVAMNYCTARGAGRGSRSWKSG